MYLYVAGLTILNLAILYFTKTALIALNKYELLFINTLLMSILVLFLFCYKCFTDKQFNKFTNFTPLHI
jgi:hypothetical protein